MYVLIVGAGQVGRTIAANLERSHEVAVVERDPRIAEDVTYARDVLTVTGDGTALETLREAGLERADMVVACTDAGETNLVVCGTAKTATNAFTIARVRRHTMLETWEGAEGAFGVDFMICTDLLVARKIVHLSGFPRAQDVETFAGGLVRMAEFEVGPESPLVGRRVRDSDQYGSVTFAGVFRDGELMVARGETRFEDGDRIVVVGDAESVGEFGLANVTEGTASTDDVVIVGGSEIGYQTAREFESHGFEPRLIERDRKRARELAEALPGALVVEGDATDAEVLARERVDEADLVVTSLDSDGMNLLVSLLARRIGADRTVAVIDNTEYTDLFEVVGIDVAVNPREETAEEIVRFTRTDRTEKIAMLEHDRAEVVEIELDPESVLTGRRIDESVADLPEGVVVAAISRGGRLVVPRGETVPQPGDHAVLFVDAAVLDEVAAAV